MVVKRPFGQSQILVISLYLESVVAGLHVDISIESPLDFSSMNSKTEYQIVTSRYNQFSGHALKRGSFQDFCLISLVHPDNLDQGPCQVGTPTPQCYSYRIFVQNREINVSLLAHSHGTKIQHFLRRRSGEKLKMKEEKKIVKSPGCLQFCVPKHQILKIVGCKQAYSFRQKIKRKRKKYGEIILGIIHK